jgi:hypothetical protein
MAIEGEAQRLIWAGNVSQRTANAGAAQASYDFYAASATAVLTAVLFKWRPESEQIRKGKINDC